MAYPPRAAAAGGKDMSSMNIYKNLYGGNAMYECGP